MVEGAAAGDEDEAEWRWTRGCECSTRGCWLTCGRCWRGGTSLRCWRLCIGCEPPLRGCVSEPRGRGWTAEGMTEEELLPDATFRCGR
eukprot:582784-Hanusia_phi.AAC.1